MIEKDPEMYWHSVEITPRPFLMCHLKDAATNNCMGWHNGMRWNVIGDPAKQDIAAWAIKSRSHLYD